MKLLLNMLLASLFNLAVFILLLCRPTVDASNIITESPVSVTALIGTNALFHCAGKGIIITWEVDGLDVYNPIIVGRGIAPVIRTSSGIIQSNLTVPATSVNNGTTLRCKIFTSSSVAVSNTSTLSIIPGVGHVVNLRFDTLFTTIVWDPPSTVGVFGGIYYEVTIIHTNSSVVIVSDNTTNTYYPLPGIQLCEYYTANVIAISTDHHINNSIAVVQKIPGDYYNFKVIKQDIIFDSISSVKLIITQILMLPGILLPCSHQRLTFQTYPQSNMSVVITHPEHVIVGTGNVVYSITTGIDRKRLYTAVVNVAGNIGIVQSLALNFSTFAVQHCDVRPDCTSILVECTFAINSTAPGFVLIQDEHSQYNINTTLQRHEGDDIKGSVSITDLPAGEYNVTVYDSIEDNDPAYIYSQHDEQHVSCIESSITVLKSPILVVLRSSAEIFSTSHDTSSPIQSVAVIEINETAAFITASITGMLLMLLLVILVTIVLLFLWRIKQKRDVHDTTTDHIPVDNNPVYITMKEIHMNKNCAYEMVDV